MVPLGDDELVQLMLRVKVNVFAVILKGLRGLFVINIADPLEEHQRKYVLLVCSGVDVGTEEDR